MLLALGIGASGVLMTAGVGEELDEVHELFVFALLGIALVHVAGVLLHTLRYRDDLVPSIIDGKKALARVGDAVAPAWGAGAVLVALALGTLGLGFAGYDPQSGSVVVPGIGWRLREAEDHEEEHGERENWHDDDHNEHGGHERENWHDDDD